MAEQQESGTIPPTQEPVPDAPRAGRPQPLDVGTVLRRLGPLSVLAGLAATLPALGGFLLLGYMEAVGDWLRAHGSAGPWIYAAGMALAGGLALLPTYAQSVVGGRAFGTAVGGPAAVGGIVGAALIGYLIARRAAGERAVQLIAEQPRWRAVYDALAGGGFGKTLLIVTLLRLPPNSPFAITNLVMAATRIRLPIYALGTALGIAPRTVLAVWIGAQFGMDKPWWLIVISIAAALVVVAVIGTIATRALHRVTGIRSA